MSITYAQLPTSSEDTFLYCDACFASYSATRGDYWDRLSDPCVCGGPDCDGNPLRLVRKVTRLVNVRVRPGDAAYMNRIARDARKAFKKAGIL